jgi:hypothetical protein
MALLESIKGHDAAFSRIISMISGDVYDTSVDNSEEAIQNDGSRYFKHKKIPLSANDRKQISKKKKREIYSPKVRTRNLVAASRPP